VTGSRWAVFLTQVGEGAVLPENPLVSSTWKCQESMGGIGDSRVVFGRGNSIRGGTRAVPQCPYSPLLGLFSPPSL